MHPNQSPSKYIQKRITFTIHQAAHLYFRLMAILIVLFVAPFIIIHFQSFSHYFSNFSWMIFLKDSFLFVFFMVVGIVLHEAIHGLTWALFVKDRLRAISFGILKESFTPYCHCKGFLQVRHYIAGAIMPAILLGILPTLWAFINASVMIFFLGIYFIVAASGDFLIIYLLKDEHRNSYVKDHETLPGCIIYKFKE